MQLIRIQMKNGEVHEFHHKGRPGGSYTVHLRYEGAFAVVEDEYRRTTSFPAADIERITTTPKEW